MRTKLLFATLFALALLSSVFGQTFGDISGEVRDTSGASIGGAQVTVVNVETNATRSAVSNEAGLYSFPALPPGTYNLKVEKEGFKAVNRPSILIQVQQSARVDIELPVGQVTESVEVSASAALLTTENATVGTVVENKRIVELPLNGRNYLQLVSLAPNVSYGFGSAGQAGSRQGGDRSSQNISVAGQRSYFNNFTLDGVNNTDPNFNSYVIQPSVDALQEFKVQTGIYPAEFGRQATQINVSTKPGTNQFTAHCSSSCAMTSWMPRTTASAPNASRTLSSGINTDSPWAAPCGFQRSTRVPTGCSSWPTMRLSGSAVM
jgi:hypothetical protein